MNNQLYGRYPDGNLAGYLDGNLAGYPDTVICKQLQVADMVL